MNENKVPNHFIDSENNLPYHFSMNENSWKSRWSDTQIQTMLFEQMDMFWNQDTGIERSKLRDVMNAADIPHAIIISGLRRAGKSTVLAQMAHKLGQDKFYYLNFEDDRLLGFRAEDSNDLFQSLVEVFGERKIFLVDEIQNVSGWEHFVRRFMDQGYKFYITGSNASLLSRELGTRLTGRYIQLELFPLSFNEYLTFCNIEKPTTSRLKTVDLAKINSTFYEYLQVGGIPDALKYPHQPILRSIYDDVIYRDVITRYRLESVTSVKELSFYLMSNPSSLVSYNKLKEHLHLGSVNTVTGYFEYLQNSWLFLTLTRFAFSVKTQQIAPKKAYAIDTGMINAVGFHFSPDTGKLLENAIFLALRRKYREIYYYQTKSGYEIDFYIPEKRLLVQVCDRIDTQATRTRELRAIEEMIAEVPVEQAVIISNTAENDTRIGDVSVSFKLPSLWLLEES